MFLAIMLLVAATFGALYVEVAQAQVVDGTITGLTLTSDAPGTLTVSWDTASPTPTDYRVDWAKSDEGYTSWKVNRGHVYPAETATTVTITDLSHDTEYKIRMPCSLLQRRTLRQILGRPVGHGIPAGCRNT